MTERGTGDASASEAEGHAQARLNCEVWGILNVTPDSFSDGGAYLRADAALTQALKMMRDGANVIDVGGESSRPTGKTYGDVAPVSEQDELARVIPAIKLLAGYGARISIDTIKAGVAERAVKHGATIINDVSCGRSEALMRVAAESGVELVLMHNRGRGERTAANTQYGASVARAVRDELRGAMDRAVSAGVRPEAIWLDPGIGFAKQGAQSAELIAHTDLFVATGQRVLIGASRKSFIGELAPMPTGGSPEPAKRLGGSLAAIALAVAHGAHAVRVHDVFESRQAVDLALAVRGARP